MSKSKSLFTGYLVWKHKGINTKTLTIDAVSLQAAENILDALADALIDRNCEILYKNVSPLVADIEVY